MNGIKLAFALVLIFACHSELKISFELSDSNFLYFLQKTYFRAYCRAITGTLGEDKTITKYSISGSYLNDIIEKKYEVIFNIKINENVELNPISENRGPNTNEVYWMIEIGHYCEESKEKEFGFNFKDLKIDSEKKTINAFFNVECKMSSALEKVLKDPATLKEEGVFKKITVLAQVNNDTQESKDSITELGQVPEIKRVI